MGGYNRDRGGDRGGRGFGGGGGGFKRPSFGGRGGRDRDEGPKRMFKAICADCGDQCEVPFKPSGDKPVLCRDCFSGGRDDRRDNRSFDRNRDDRGDRGGRDRDFHREKPNRFDDEAPKQDSTKEKLAAIEAKLDRILKLITPVISVSKEQHAEVAAKMPTEAIETEKTEAKPKAKRAKKAKIIPEEFVI